MSANIFLTCGDYTLDEYWKQIFSDCAKNKFPKGCRFDATTNMLYIHSKTLTTTYVTYDVTKNSPQQICNDFKRLCQEHLGMKSEMDKEDDQREIEDLCKTMDEVNVKAWSQIKKKNARDPIIRGFIIDCAKQYNLDAIETDQLTNVVKTGFLFNWISKDDVVFNNRKIQNITSLCFDEEERIFKVDKGDINYKRDLKIKPQKMSALWDKYNETK